MVISKIISIIKTFGITAASNPLIEILSVPSLADLIKDCANNKSKGAKYSSAQIVEIFGNLQKRNEPESDQEKLKFLQKDYTNKQSVIKILETLRETDISANPHVREIEENTEAINILSRFHKTKCIVCDSEDINWEALLKNKTANRKATLEKLDDKIREVIEQTIPLVPSSDPFGIKSNLLTAIETGNKEIINALCEDFFEYMKIYDLLLTNQLIEIFEGSSLSALYSEYQKIISTRPEIADEDYLYIQEIISNSMSKPLTIERDQNNRLRIYLSNQEFLGKDRDELPLSTGEQNFLSLTFEFLKAKNSDCPIVVIDDPVSSFDSIYKNKVVYAIVKMLHHKQRIVLTHNTDLIRLLDGQYRKCFKLYLLNNTDGEVNGFLPLKSNEQEMLISLEKLLDAFRKSVPKQVVNKELFLISMIPFMRGYANVVGNGELFEELTQVMHGYKTGTVDIARSYNTLFGPQNEFLPTTYLVSVRDILTKTVDGIHLLDQKAFPLLDRTLRHSFIYLFLRLLVEKKLVEKFNIDTERYSQLGQIINAAFPDEKDFGQIRNRIRLTSKKTLINEFNHFEGNLSIFQPAIDITDQALGKERQDLLSFFDSL